MACIAFAVVGAASAASSCSCLGGGPGPALRPALACGPPRKWDAGANVLGGKIKEEASAAGRRRGTFDPKGIRTLAQPAYGRGAFPSKPNECGRQNGRRSSGYCARTC